MADGRIVVEMDSEEYKLLQGIKSVSREWSQFETGAKQSRDTARAAAREQEEWGRKAKQVWEQTRTPMEVYYRKYQDLNELVKRGKIDQETYARAVRQAGDEYGRAGESGKKAFGVEALAMITRYAAGLVGIGTAIRTATGLLDEFQRRGEEAGQRAMTEEEAASELAQLSKGKPEKYRELVQAGRYVHAQGGTRNLSDAYRLIFQLESAEAMEEMDLFAGLGKSRLVSDPAMAARAAQSLRKSMGAQETGTFRDILEKAMVAAGPSPGSLDELIAGASRAGVGAKTIGITDEEVLAAIGVVVSATGGFEQREQVAMGSTKVASLMRSLSQVAAGRTGAEDMAQSLDEFFAEATPQFDLAKGKKPKLALAGKSLMQQVEEIEKLKLEPGQLRKLLGRAEAFDAYQVILREREQYGKLAEDVKRAPAQKGLGAMMGVTETDPIYMAARARRIATAQRQMGEETQGAWQNVSEAFLEQWQDSLREEGRPFWGRYLLDKAARTHRWLVGAERFARGWKGGYDEAASAEMQLEAEARSQNTETQGTEKLDEAATKLGIAADQLLRITRLPPILDKVPVD